ncbi:MAG: Fe-S protein [Burkholderiales bacterium]|nr:Fe-S protein [Burkholderiales bacterium]
MRIFSNRRRPVHLGPLPLERVRRAAAVPDLSRVEDAFPARSRTALGRIVNDYIALFEQFRAEPAAPERAPYPRDPQRLANELKANCYFLDATLAGCCEVPASAWTGPKRPEERWALAIAVEFGREPDAEDLAARWVRGSEYDCALLRAAEIALVCASFLRRLGFSATAHTRDATEVSHARILVAAGLARWKEGRLVAPFIGSRFASAVVTTSEPLAPDAPLADGFFDGGLGWWLGAGGTETWWNRRFLRRRPSHAGRYPMEKIRRVATPTTLVLEDEVPRVPKRANFFTRAAAGDLGEKAQRERSRFAYKTPIADAYVKLIRAMVPRQGGDCAPARDPATHDPAANARALKSLMYFLGADMVGLCEAKPYCWYSHQEDGTPIAPYHRNAAVMLVDQGFETMEGASGDDWISGAQSMRAYLRGAEICGVAAAFIRSLGWSARSQTNADSDVVQLPLVLLAGLGELSRIGELVLNPFVGPRFKSAVVTTDLPLAPDRPVDFGLQDMCAKCSKCARECPCSAISFGEKVMFNGYEMWKPDVERCTRYRVTNPHGSACGRCMKTCPYNHEGLLLHRAFLWAAIRLPWTRRAIVRLDDWVGNGAINPVKTWWTDLEIVEGRVVKPRGANRRGLSLDKGTAPPPGHRIAYYPAAVNPPADAKNPVPVDRKAALSVRLETPEEARRRRGLAAQRGTSSSST